jgi:uncharacterized protein
MTSKSSEYLATRLKPNEDLKKFLIRWVQVENIKSAVVLSGVGSLKVAQLRLANSSTTNQYAGPFEIVSMTGTLGPDGVHVHLSIADSSGQVIGGHLVEGCIIHTTCELVLMTFLDMTFNRELCEDTGYKELVLK